MQARAALILFILFAVHASVFPFRVLAQGQVTPNSIITTVVGTSWTFQGNRGPALSASLGEVWGLATRPGGDLYVADTGNHVVMRITPDGTLTVVAGNSLPGFSGDGGPATSASLNWPRGLALDTAGNLYIADSFNARIRKVTPDGIITTVAGGKAAGAVGDGGPAVDAGLTVPFDVAVDLLGNLFIADTNNNRIRKVNSNGIISTVAGSGPAGAMLGGFSGDGGPATSALLNLPNGVFVDAAGNILIADRNNHRIRKVTPDGVIQTIAGSGATGLSAGGFAGDGGPATSALLGGPASVTMDTFGNILIAEAGGNRIRKIAPDGTISSVNFPGVSLKSPGGIAADSGGNIYVTDTGNLRVRKLTSDGAVIDVGGSGFFKYGGDGGPATSASLHLGSPLGDIPNSIAIDTAGNLYVPDPHNHRVRKVNPSGIITTVAGNGLPGSSGDGGLATAARLTAPRAIALDTSGNLYIVDSHSVRKVSAAGIISTIAGAADAGFSGDGGPATAARLNTPNGIAVDTTGTVYIGDTNNNRVRKVSPQGIITTYAGKGAAGAALGGFSGDGQQATDALLSAPAGLALDLNGNLYIADLLNQRVRKVNTGGIITTVAGSGNGGFGGDGGPATSATFTLPYGVAVDGAGNLYIAPFGSRQIRKVNPQGIISTIAGTGAAAFLGDGGPAVNASFNNSSGVALDGIGNLYITDSNNDRIRKVLVSSPSYSLAPASLDFSARASSGQALVQKITATSSVVGVAWTGQVATQSGGNWLSISPSSGLMPSVVDVQVDAGNLAPGTYQGTVTFQAPFASLPQQSVAIRLTVDAALPAKLVVEPATLSYETTVGTNPEARTLRVTNAGGGSLQWSARAETISGVNWLRVSPASGSLTAGSPAQLQVVATGSTLPVGVHSGAVLVESSTTNETVRVPVSLLVLESRQRVLVSQNGLLFTGVEGGAAVPQQSFGVLNVGEGLMNWSVQASTLAGGNWLTVSPGSGTTDAASLRVPLVEVGVNISGLPAGQYSGLVRVDASPANDSPQFVTVELNILPRGSNPGALVRPTGMIFSARTGTSSPGSQIVKVTTLAGGTVEAVTGLLTRDGGNWLEVAPRNTTLTFNDNSHELVVQPALGSLRPGIYRGALTLLFTDNSPPQVVSILFLVVGPAGTSAVARKGDSTLPRADADCIPSRLHAVQRTWGTSFSSPVAVPSTIEVQVADDCGNPVPDALVIARFSNGDPVLPLTSLQNGIYVGSWRPANEASLVSVTIRAEYPPLQAAEVQAQGGVTANATTPALFTGGVVNGASFAAGEPVTPGGIISVFGRNLARGLNSATQLPLERSLGGATLSIGGIEAPLFFSSDGQINAQVPFEIAPNSRPAVVVQSTRQNGAKTLALPETITVAVARPAIFSINQQGTGQGAILNQDFTANSASNPAARGSVVQIFATGLGATNPAVVSGQPAPGDPVARVTSEVQAKIGGQAAAVQFAGLAPSFVGLYQVNVVVPPGVAPGSSVELTLTQNGVPSNTVTVAIR